MSLRAAWRVGMRAHGKAPALKGRGVLYFFLMFLQDVGGQDHGGFLRASDGDRASPPVLVVVIQTWCRGRSRPPPKAAAAAGLHRRVQPYLRRARLATPSAKRI